MKQSRTSGRAARLAVTGLAVAAVAGITITGAAIAGTGKPSAGAEPPAAGGGGIPAATAGKPPVAAKDGSRPSQVDQAAGVPQVAPKAVAKGKYLFQNKPPAVGALPANGSVEIAADVTFRTKGTQWALVSHAPGEEPYEPFGWRATVGNANIGDGTSPGIQSLGSGEDVVANSVFRNSKVATVVYTRGTKAWYAKVYRLAGIPGWVESNALVDAGNQPRQTPAAGHSITRITGPDHNELAVFVYDAAGKLLKQFPDNAENPLPK
ncbi:hypothetical protein [Kribbella monticola]|uniref:hypothetical protein n=1 Tax=Kribbella monticola TaxID=2185285 RepID=UPI000DD336A1|nr:hypothetical protein [Kribbella monticola]